MRKILSFQLGGKTAALALGALCYAQLAPLHAEDVVQPQQVSVKASIDPGPNVFTSTWHGAGAIHVFSATDLKYKGNVTSGSMGEMLISRDGRKAFTASVYMKRIVYGDAEVIFQTFDIPTLTPISEIPLPPKIAMVTASPELMGASVDGRLVYVQNATPATSVTVVDVQAGRFVEEIPSPGCYGIYPALTGHRLTMVCGDGSFLTLELNADGHLASRHQSEKVFDADKDPIFITSARVGSDLAFMSFHGVLYRINDQDSTARLVDSHSITTGIDGGWAPGGAQIMAYNGANDVLFVGMHPNATDGSHKRPAKEIWSYGVTNRKVLHRSPVEDVLSMTVSDAALPVVYASKYGKLMRLEADPRGGFELRKTHEVHNPGPYNVNTVFRP